MTTLAADPPAPRLPQEIFDIIINHYHFDKSALSVLGIVSWSWLHSARRHLFAKVELCELREALDTSWRVNFGLEIITRSPAIASCILFVQIRTNRNDQYLVTQGFQFLSLLPNLRALSLTGIFWPSFQPENVPTILRGIATIAPVLEELSLTLVTFANTADLAMFVRAFPMVQRVSFSRCEWECNWLAPPAPTTSVFRELPQPPVKTLICLEHVCIHDSVPQAILEVLLQRDTFKLDLQGANIYWDTGLESLENFSIYEKFFAVVGANLQTLELRVRVRERHEPDAIIQLLSKCRQLWSFSINISGCQRRRMVFFESILETATVSSLKEFTIHCTLGSALKRKRFIPWEKVDDTLSDAARLPVFGKLTVIIYNSGFGLSVDPSSRDAVYDNLSESMPRLLQARMLRISEPEE